jgi:hypothetical protein
MYFEEKSKDVVIGAHIAANKICEVVADFEPAIQQTA